MSVQFIQVNSRNLQETVEKINGKKCIGFEVVNPTIIELLDCNIDPQHTGVKVPRYQFSPENKSASLVVLEMLSTIDETIHDTVVFEKIDIDAVCAATIWLNADKLANMENDPYKHEDFLKLCQRVKSVDEMDCGLGSQGIEWNPNYFSQQLIKEITPFNVLGCMCSDFKLPIVEKINIMFDWLTEGKLPENYRQQVEKEMAAQSKSFTETIHGVTCVTSKSRGATGILYSQVPFGVCYNPEFPIKDGTVPKFTVCEFTAGRYLDLPSILTELNEIESGWGGNLQAGIIGSPFAGTSLKPEQVCEIVSRHVK